MNADERLKLYERMVMIACLNDEFKRLNKRTDDLMQMAESAHTKGDAGKLIVYEAEMAMNLRIMELLKSMLKDTTKGLE